MSSNTSPTRHPYGREYEDNFTADISQKMRVPKHIDASGGAAPGYNSTMNHWISPVELQEKFNMQVPERILPMGQDQYMGTKAPPRELQLENAVLPPDPGLVRVQTPPRVISLDEHFIPAADEMIETTEFIEMKVSNNRPRQFNYDNGNYRPTMRDSSFRDSTPPLGVNDSWREGSGGAVVSTADEVVMLRKQVVNLSRRVFRMESVMSEMAQREKALFGFCLAYIAVKTFLWLRSNA